jgi:hypothetical protein
VRDMNDPETLGIDIIAKAKMQNVKLTQAADMIFADQAADGWHYQVNAKRSNSQFPVVSPGLGGRPATLGSPLGKGRQTGLQSQPGVNRNGKA